MRFIELRRYEAALAAYEEAEGIRRQLAAQQPEVYAPDLARTLTNKGNALQELRRYEAAVAAYEEAEGLYRRWQQPAARGVCTRSGEDAH
jgi:tetratricopeptide (TPR) repeat protein